MIFSARISSLLLAAIVSAPSLCLPAFAQDRPTLPASDQMASTPADPHADIHLDVVVTGKSGPPVANLPQSAFTLLDNKAPLPIKSFRAVGSNAPVEIVLVIDSVNLPFQSIAYLRSELAKFFSSNGGQLARPIRLVLVTDTGTQASPRASNDGNELLKELNQFDIGLRTIRRNSGFYGASDRLDISLRALQAVTASEAQIPARKLVVWLSPGWPLLSGVRVDLSSKEQANIFSEVVQLSNQFRQTGITLYSVDPRGTNSSLEGRVYYENFVKGVTKPGQTDEADLSLQVLSEQSGGLVLNGTNDIAALVRRCADDASAFYEITFTPPPADQPHQYHALQVRVSDPGLTARTRQGYYTGPETGSEPFRPETPTKR